MRLVHDEDDNVVQALGVTADDMIRMAGQLQKLMALEAEARRRAAAGDRKAERIEEQARALRFGLLGVRLQAAP